MSGEVDPQSSMFHYFSVESRIPADCPLLPVKKLAGSALPAISAELDGHYAKGGSPSIWSSRQTIDQVDTWERNQEFGQSNRRYRQEGI